MRKDVREILWIMAVIVSVASCTTIGYILYRKIFLNLPTYVTAGNEAYIEFTLMVYAVGFWIAQGLLFAFGKRSSSTS